MTINHTVGQKWWSHYWQNDTMSTFLFRWTIHFYKDFSTHTRNWFSFHKLKPKFDRQQMCIWVLITNKNASWHSIYVKYLSNLSIIRSTNPCCKVLISLFGDSIFLSIHAKWILLKLPNPLSLPNLLSSPPQFYKINNNLPAAIYECNSISRSNPSSQPLNHRKVNIF